MNKPVVFISYSRQQFYFAEALAIHLKKANVANWFDVQQLRPGSDWEDGIQRGLQESSALVLVAARTALNSPYVRHEWEHALQTGKPVVIAIFENVNLPPKLANVPCIDFRGRFNPALKRLARKLLDPTAPSDRAARSWRMPPGVALVVLALLGSVALALPPGLAALPYVAQERYFGLNLGLFVAAGFCGAEIWRFLKRQSTPAYTTFILVVAALFVPLLVILIQERLYRSQQVSIVNQNFYLALCGVNLLLAIVSAVLLYYSPDILRWLPTGQATTGHRRWVYQRRRKLKSVLSSSLSNIQRRYYRLHYVLPDEPAATLIISTLLDIGFYLRKDVHEEDEEFIILSNHTTPELYARALQSGKRVVSIVISQLPNPPAFDTLTRYQWIDFRTRAPEQLKMAVQYLFKVEQNPLDLTLGMVPENFQRVVIPFELVGLTFLPRMYGAFTAAIWLVMMLPLVALVSEGNAGVLVFFVIFSVFAFGHTLLMFWMANGMTNRVLSRDACSQICIGLSVVIFLLSVPLGTLLIPMPYLAVWGQLRNKNTRTAAWLPAYNVNPRSALRDRRGWLVNAAFILVIALLFSPAPVDLFLRNLLR
jgi:hypothetical protein